jgi:hypothetical protein
MKSTRKKSSKKTTTKKTFRAQVKPKRAKAEMLPGAQAEHRKLLKARNQPLTAQQRVQAALTGSQVRYNAPDVRFDTDLRYVVDDPTPIPGKAKVKLELKSRSDANLIGFGHAHDEAIASNPYFPTPQPTELIFDAALAAYEAKVSEIEIHHEAGKALTNDRDLLRAEFELLFNQRGSYVEMTSQGDASWIMSAALPVKNGRTPMGVLPYPLALTVDLGDVAGAMTIRWQSVSGAKTYMLEIAEVVDNVPVGWTLAYMGGKYSTRKEGMTVGKVYAFRVAAVGGEGGMSSFSPPVTRAAA